MNWCCQGQRAGIRSVRSSAACARQPGGDLQQLSIGGSGRLLDGLVGGGRSGLPRCRGCPRAPRSRSRRCSAFMRPEGKFTSAWSLRSRMAKLDGGVVAVIDVGDQGRDGAVGRKVVVAPVGEQLGLRADEAGCRAHDQPEALRPRSRRSAPRRLRDGQRRSPGGPWGSARSARGCVLVSLTPIENKIPRARGGPPNALWFFKARSRHG